MCVLSSNGSIFVFHCSVFTEPRVYVIGTAAFKARCFAGASQIQNHHLWLQLFVCQAATVVPGDRAALQLNPNEKSGGPQAD